MVLKLHYKRASTCLYQVVRFSLKKNGAICIDYSINGPKKRVIKIHFQLIRVLVADFSQKVIKIPKFSLPFSNFDRLTNNKNNTNKLQCNL